MHLPRKSGAWGIKFECGFVANPAVYALAVSLVDIDIPGIPCGLSCWEEFSRPVTLVHVDAHLDWRQQSNGVSEGFRSPLRPASERPWIEHIVQIGIRGNGSLSCEEVRELQSLGADIITAYEMHEIGIDAVLERIPQGAYYVSIDADGLDPTIMPGVQSPTPGGLSWVQTHRLLHGLARRGRILAMDLVEIAPSFDSANLTLVHAERLLFNFIGACVHAGYYARESG